VPDGLTAPRHSDIVIADATPRATSWSGVSLICDRAPLLRRRQRDAGLHPHQKKSAGDKPAL
jgi:hypothetical protein